MSKKTVNILNENLKLKKGMKDLVDKNLELESKLEEAQQVALQCQYDLEVRKKLMVDLVDKYEKLAHLANQLERENSDCRAKLYVETGKFEMERKDAALQAQLLGCEKNQECVRFKKAVDERDDDLKRVAGIAMNILEQRSEVEAYLGNAIAYVKQRLNRRCMVLAGTLPLDFAERLFKDKDKDKDKVVDWDTLGWEERERVLRYLFMQINSVKKRPKTKKALLTKPCPPCEMVGQSLVPTVAKSNKGVQTNLKKEKELGAVVLTEPTMPKENEEAGGDASINSEELEVESTLEFIESLLEDVLDFD